MKCVYTPRRIRHLCSTESLVCVFNTLGCLFNSPSSAPSSCWWWSLLIMEPENTRHSFPTLSVARSWAWEPIEPNGQEGTCTEALLRKPGRWEEPSSLSLVWRWPLGQWLSCGGLWMWGFYGRTARIKVNLMRHQRRPWASRILCEIIMESKEIKQVSPKRNQSWIFIGRTGAETDVPVFWPPDANSQLSGKDPDAEKDWGQEEKRVTEDEMVRWHYQFNGHEFEQAPGVGNGQDSLVCCSPWGHKEVTPLSDWTTTINNELYCKPLEMEYLINGWKHPEWWACCPNPP